MRGEGCVFLLFLLCQKRRCIPFEMGVGCVAAGGTGTGKQLWRPTNFSMFKSRKVVFSYISFIYETVGNGKREREREQGVGGGGLNYIYRIYTYYSSARRLLFRQVQRNYHKMSKL